MECPLCFSEELRDFASWPDFKIISCTACGFRFIDTTVPGYPDNAQYIYDEGNIETNNLALPHIQRRVHDVLRYKLPPGKALDVGCGGGEVSLALSDKGFECTGIDMNPGIISYLKSHFSQVRWKKISSDELAGFSDRYDVITMYHVLEHIVDFRAALSVIKSLASPAALIVIEVPNRNGLKARILGRRWDYYKVDHVNYFREKDLRLLASEIGLEVLAVKGYQHFSYPQDVLWKDVIKGIMAWLGFKDIISIFLRA